jgi:hypothetical protein
MQQLVSIGIALDWSLSRGMELLTRFGPFDEALIGRSWLNTGAVKYVWGDLPGIAAVPQIIIVEREVLRIHGTAIKNERVIVRRAGADAIINWARASSVGR